MNDSESKLNVLSVSQVTSLLKSLIDKSFYDITLRGEISNFSRASSGHWYFQLNDADAAIQAVMFKTKSWKVGFAPKDGDMVIVHGNISIYEKRGSYQILCDSMIPIGRGDILAMLEERKRDFAAAGYFDQNRKRPIPSDPRKVAVVTSPTGAAIRDIIQVMGRRDPSVEIIILPASVQGDEAAATIAAQIYAANRMKIADVIIVTRGGGSLEDLLPFSERIVIEAIVNSTLPVVSAVGHEIDWALSDYAADLRCPTPSAAAELVTSDRQERLAKVRMLSRAMANALQANVELAKSLARRFSTTRMADYLTHRIQTMRMLLDDHRGSLIETINSSMQHKRHRFQLVDHALRELSPMTILKRGYSITMLRESKCVLSDAKDAPIGTLLDIIVANGTVGAIVDTDKSNQGDTSWHTKQM
ncbi:MAG: exodeoxyribonuclease VII large subunit [Sphaerochaetaceae bacterium]|jgi:exodeoxyribonuclease VII large subunit|nr:exodeoxyribonuclease VII large subunit [Sphaerochaetaceae bacterium]NLO61733.1 exodeoxyribonuclease VII large subunit [Spirochaetales bacterium]MDD3670918.1 exodeoxyribonuclease VII large subunit [Sphaerochaetaceae bacterium]MDD4259213.1 exodeoxyribonuclease VII large subunit [Sphaerochaetaceae bacterium]MDD4840836.1 exodeoxyribonuclease VII large subunit [Sphaerochaetaceae bacterium]